MNELLAVHIVEPPAQVTFKKRAGSPWCGVARSRGFIILSVLIYEDGIRVTHNMYIT